MRYLLLGACIALAGCAPEPAPKRAEGADTAYYFNGEIEGCRLFSVRPTYGDRFQLAICGHSATTTSRVMCGKGCYRDDAVRTER